ncbi:MAG: permease-like cell division protein FtsX [Candidatus Andersenbacteria bacterium]
MQYFQLRRVVRAGFQNFWRNLGLSVATTFVTTLTLLAVSSILLVNFLLGIAIKSVESKVDISVYFDPLASAQQVAEARAEIENIPGVASVQLISRDEALAAFKQQHANDPLINQSLKELNDNPLQTTLTILAEGPDDYAAINTALTSKVDGQVIDKVNYEDNRATIERLSYLSRWASLGGLVVGIALAGIAVLVVFNTVRLTIFSRREEVGIMKLVGANNSFVRGPFILEGALYGFLASLITVALLQPLLLWLSPKVEGFFGTSSGVFEFVQTHLVLVILGELAVGVLLGVGSSFLAIRRYLKV